MQKPQWCLAVKMMPLIPACLHTRAHCRQSRSDGLNNFGSPLPKPALSHRQEVRHQGCSRRTRGAMKHFFGLGQNESRVEEQDPCVLDLVKFHVIAEWWADLVDK